MIKIKIIALGSLKEKYLSAAIAEYSKRLSAYCDFEIIELSPVRLPDNPSISEISSALEKEADLVIKKIPNGSCVFALCIEGEQLSSEELSKKIMSTSASGTGSFVFLIGSSYGLAERVKKTANFRLSFSKLTFPHQLFRVMLCEQIYRAFKIADGGKYHK